MADKVQDFAVNSARWLSLEDFDGESWKEMVGYEDYYLVSNYGRVKTKTRMVNFVDRWGNCRPQLRKEIIKKQQLARGYYEVNLFNKNYTVHRLVAITFIPNPQNKAFVDHINEIKTDNRVQNLRWVTSSENRTNPITFQKMRVIQKTCKPIVILRVDGSFVTEYPTIKGAARGLGVRDSSIIPILSGRKKGLVLGFQAKYRDEYDPQSDNRFYYDERASNFNHVPSLNSVAKLSECGEIIDVFTSTYATSNELGLSRSHYLSICEGIYNTKNFCYFRDLGKDEFDKALDMYYKKYADSRTI